MEFDPLPQQRLAIEAPLGPLLVVAGPGAGKTFCLIARINHLITTLGIAPQRICAVTFTNRAAEEIGVRLTHTLRDRAEAITRGTIHALCLALLREHTEAAGLRKGFGVADELYQKVILGRLHVPLEQRGPLLNRFGRDRVQAYELTADDARLYREYTGWLAQRNMLDFDDLVAHAATLMRTRGDVADAIAARWDYLLVDEFQDVNAVQYDLLTRSAMTSSRSSPGRERTRTSLCGSVAITGSSDRSCWTGTVAARVRSSRPRAACSHRIPSCSKSSSARSRSRRTRWRRGRSATKQKRRLGCSRISAATARPRAWDGATTPYSIAGTRSASTSRGGSFVRGFPAGWRAGARSSKTTSSST